MDSLGTSLKSRLKAWLLDLDRKPTEEEIVEMLESLKKDYNTVFRVPNSLPPSQGTPFVNYWKTPYGVNGIEKSD